MLLGRLGFGESPTTATVWQVFRIFSSVLIFYPPAIIGISATLSPLFILFNLYLVDT